MAVMSINTNEIPLTVRIYEGKSKRKNKWEAHRTEQGIESNLLSLTNNKQTRARIYSSIVKEFSVVSTSIIGKIGTN